MVSPEFSLHFLPRPEVSTPVPSKPNTNTSAGHGKGSERPRQERDGPYKGKPNKGKGKGKTKTPSVSMPLPLRGLNPRTKDNRPKCFDFNMGHGCSNKDGQCQKGDHSCMSWSCGDAKHSYQTCHAKNKKPNSGSSA